MNYTLLSGGVREASSNKKLAKCTYSYLSNKDNLKADLFNDLTTGVPFVSEAEEELPKALSRARESLINAKKVIVFTPVLNGGYAPSLKNALDWLSLSFDNYEYNELYKGKKVAVMSSVLGQGGNSQDARNMLGHQLEKYGFLFFKESYLLKNAEENISHLTNESSEVYIEFSNFLEEFIKF
ncbi:MAG: NADPH-dependent oxidoreductase [Candidatus Actinomarinales bacterium]|nr:MAG: NADPH-dependent oxidoreductase [Candidatus Actinomarinales bacterium]